MARSWERMVKKNSTHLNKQRKKQGQPSIYGSKTSVTADIYKGRNYILPLTLVALAVLYFLLGTLGQQNVAGSGMTWAVMGLYVLLGVIIFLRRPYLRVEKNVISTTKFNRDRRLTAENISKIKLAAGSVVIEQKGKGGNWVFTRLINRYDTTAMGERLERFAKTFDIPVEK